VHVCSRSGSASLKSPAASVIPSCVCTVASDTVDSGRATVAPSLRRLPSCDVVRVSKALHHGRGLYPSGMHPPPVFLLPSVLSCTGWCRRGLTLEETWGLHDVPHPVVELLQRHPQGAAAAWKEGKSQTASRSLFGMRRAPPSG
jgi:hypothetical protein